MRRTVLFSVLFLILGFGLGMTALLLIDRYLVPSIQAPPAESQTLLTGGAPSQEEASDLVEQAYEVAEAMREKDWPALAACVSPTRGVTFTPYSTVSESDVGLNRAQVAVAGDDATLYTWGLTDGSGFPIECTISDYFDEYVFNADYTQAPILGVNTIISSGNALENLETAYPDAQFVDFYFPGLEEANEGFDWCSMKLVFQWEEASWKLIAVVHGEWTI